MNIPKSILADIKKKLEDEKDKITLHLDSLKTQDPFSNPDRLIDNAASDTEASEESSHERVEALEKELRNHLLEIEEALKKVDVGTYGKCISCGNYIDAGRLAVKPTALFCFSCENSKVKKV